MRPDRLADPKPRPWNGVYAALIAPMEPRETALDLDALAAHARDATAGTGLIGVMVNGHAGENFLLTREEKRQVTETVVGAIGRTSIVVSGINAEATREAARHAEDAARAGADALMIFAPNAWAGGADADMILSHHRAIVDATDLPVMLFQGSVASRMAFAAPVLAKLLAMPRVVAVKEGSWEVAAYERTLRLAQAAAPHVAIMGSGDEHLMTSFVVGSEGSVVSLAAVLPRHVAALDRAVLAGDLAAARRLHGVIQPLAGAVYGAFPGAKATARLKCLLAMMGKIPSDAVRAPFAPPDAAERARLKALLDAALAVSPETRS